MLKGPVKALVVNFIQRFFLYMCEIPYLFVRSVYGRVKLLAPLTIALYAFVLS